VIERRHRIVVLFLEELTITQLLATQRPLAHPPLACPPAPIDPRNRGARDGVTATVRVSLWYMTNVATPSTPDPNPPFPNPGGAAEETGWQAGTLPAPPDEAERRDFLWQHLVAQFRWYDRAANRCRRPYQALKIASLVLGGAVTVLAAIGAPAWLTASLAASIVAAEGIQQLFQLHTYWISYRATAEALRQQAFLYSAHVDPYADPATRRDRLADVVRAITVKENTSWAKAMQQNVRAANAAT
jgi:hypothetical protein